MPLDTTTLKPPTWRAHRKGPYISTEEGLTVQSCCFLVKVFVLAAVLACGIYAAARGLLHNNLVHFVYGTFAVANALRVLWQMTHWRRPIAILEATFEMVFLFPGTLILICYVPAIRNDCIPTGTTTVCPHTAHAGRFMLCGVLVAITGFVINVGSEMYRANVVATKGPGLVTTGPFSCVRHPNYAGELLIWTGGCIMGGTQQWFALVLCVFPMCAGMYLWSVRELESYLECTYGKTSVAQWRASCHSAIFPWPHKSVKGVPKE